MSMNVHVRCLKGPEPKAAVDTRVAAAEQKGYDAVVVQARDWSVADVKVEK